MLRIFLIISLVGGLAAAAISGYFVRNVMLQTLDERNDFQTKFNNETKAKNEALAKLKKTETELAETKTKLTQTESDLTAANSKVTDLESQNADLTATLTRTKGERDTAEQELDKWRQLSVTPEQVKGIIADLAKTKQDRDNYIAQNKILTHSRDDWKKRFQDLVGQTDTVAEPPGLIGKIVDVDPKYGFVVLDIGADNGVLERGEMMVNHEGRLVGKVRIISVAKNTSIANILPDWTRGEISEDCRVID
jgi:cell shape-determining protein MreC